MAAVRDTPVAAATGFDDDAAIEAAIRSALAAHGPALLFDVDRVRDALQDRGAAGSPFGTLLLTAQAHEVPQRLLGAHTDDDVASRIATLATSLVDLHGMAPADAQRAVSGWARILDLGDAPIAGAVVTDESRDATDAVPVERRHAPTKSLLPATLLHRGRSATFVQAAIVLVIGALLAWFGLFRPSMTIVDVSSAGPLVADGVAHDVTVTFESRRTAIRGVEVNAVGSDAAPRFVAAAPHGDAQAVRVGSIAMQDDRGGRATYRYVLVADDGARSAPFEKTYDFAAAPPRPPVITSIAVPPDLVAHRPFALVIGFAAGSRPIAQLEMRVASSTVAWKSQVVTSDVASTAPSPVRYLFEAGILPSRTTLDFTMIDRSGVRSAPQRVVLDVRKPASTVACTPTTCGRVVAARRIEPTQGLADFFRRIFARDDRRVPPVYEVVVVRDDGATRVLGETTRWSAGARVRIVGRSNALRCVDSPGRCT